jgi:hypothetical protein
VREPHPGDEGWTPPPRQASIDMGRMIGRLAILVAALLIVVNIPVTRYGVSLARIMPETGSLIIRDGLVLKGSGPEIYVLQDDKLRWISSLDAFEHMGLSWKDVHIVEDEFLETKDIDTFTSEGHVWDDVRFVSCQYLRELPDGPPIPEDAGPPPEP